MYDGILAYQGEPGAFSELAARHFGGGSPRLLPCSDFQALFAAVCEGQAQWGVVPVENALAGPVIECMELLRAQPVEVVDNTALNISLALIACQPVALNTIKRIYSHPMAILQCARFLSEHPNITASSVQDTAGAVRMIIEMNDLSIAAVASAHCTEIYGGSVICSNLQRELSNRTRFVLIRRASVLGA